MAQLLINKIASKPLAKRRAFAAFFLALYIGFSICSLPAMVYAAEPTPEHPLQSCSPTKLSMCIAGIFYVFFVDLTSPIAYLGGAMFDTVAALSLQGPTYASLMISKAWVIARDVANMVFVFLLLTIAIELILDLESAGIGKKLAKILVVALLINFSFFFSRVTIDVSNMAAHVFYDNITVKSAIGTAVQSSVVLQGVQQLVPTSISEQILNGINPQNLLGTDGFKKFYNNSKSGFIGNLAMLLTLFFIFGVINIILAFVFVTAAFQFLTRIIGLWMAIILSPLAFVCAVLPIGKKYWKEWLDLLLHNAFFAPAFLFVVYIMVTMVSNNSLTTDIGAFLGAQANGSSVSDIRTFLNTIVGVLLRLGIVVGLFYGATMIGTKMGVTAAQGARGWAEKFTTTPAKAYTGFVYRNTVGSGFGTGYGVGKLDDKFKKSYLGNTRLGNAIRSISTKPLVEGKVLGAPSYRDSEKLGKELRQNQQNIERDKNNKAAVKEMNTKLAAAQKATYATPTGRTDAIKKIEREARAKIQSFTTRDLEAFKPGEISGKDGFARFMSAKQKDAIDGIKDFTDTQKSAIKKDWGKRTALDPTGTGGSSEAPLNEIDDVVAQLKALNGTTRSALRVTQAGLKKKAEVEADRANIKSQIGVQRRIITTVNQDLRGLPTGSAAHNAKLDELETAEAEKKALEDIDDKLKDFGEKLKKIKHGEGNGPTVNSATEGEFEVV